jgi:hypothetical protein
VKAGNNASGACPGCGEYIMNLYGKENTNRCKDGSGAAEYTDQFGTSTELFNVYPNPFTHQATIDATFNQDDVVTIDVVSMEGKTVQQVYTGEVISQMPYRFTLNSENMKNGVYLIRVAGAHLVEYHKVILQK